MFWDSQCINLIFVSIDCIPSKEVIEISYKQNNKFFFKSTLFSAEPYLNRLI